ILVQDSSATVLTATHSYTLAVAASGPTALTIMSSDIPNGSVAAAYSTTLAAAGGSSPYSWSLTSGSLPAGLTLNASTGTISGTPLLTGWSNLITVQVTDAANATASLPYSMVVSAQVDQYGGLM